MGEPPWRLNGRPEGVKCGEKGFDPKIGRHRTLWATIGPSSEGGAVGLQIVEADLARRIELGILLGGEPGNIA